MAIIKTYDISSHGPSISVSAIGGRDDWEVNSQYRYSYHKEASLWSDWKQLSLDELNSKTFKDKHVDIEIEIVGETQEDFPVFAMEMPDDPTCELPSISVNENTTDGPGDDEPCIASIRITDCDDIGDGDGDSSSSNIFNPYSTGSAPEIYNELSAIVSDTFGFDCRYFRTSPVRNSADYIFHEFSLKNVSVADDIKVVVEDNKLPSRTFAINNPLLDYQETLTVHIVKSEFRGVFGVKTYPREHDYLAFNFTNFNKMYEVIGVYNPDDFLYEAAYWIVLLQPYQERSMVGYDNEDSEVIKDREKAAETNSPTADLDDGDLTKEIEIFTFNKKAEEHKKAAKLDTEKARGDSLLNDKILDSSRKRSDFIADTYDRAVKCEKEVIYHMNIPVANYNYVLKGKGTGSCAVLYHKFKNDPICRISFIFKPLATITRNMPVLSDGETSVWMTRKSISVKRGEYIKTFSMSESMTNAWHIISIIMDEDEPSMTRVSVWRQERDIAHSRDKFVSVITEGSAQDELYKPYPLLNDADYGEVCLFGGPYSIANIKIATNPLSEDKEFSEAIAQVSQDMQTMIVSDMAAPRITSESIMPLVKHPDQHEKKPIPMFNVSLSADPVSGGSTSGSGEYPKDKEISISASPSIGYVFSEWSDGETDPSRTLIVDKDITLSAKFEVEESVVIDDGALPGLFSVSEDEKVRFSRGNLRYLPNENIWSFAETQNSFIGEGNTNISPDMDTQIDLFGWGCTGNDTGAISYQPYDISDNDKDYYDNGDPENDMSIDWGHNKISNGGDIEDKWFTLSQSQWEYLYSKRENAESLRTRGCVDGINGYVFFPDDWVCPDGVNVVIDTARYTNNEWTSVIWNLLEKSGAVFLPAGGDRDGEDVDEVNSYGDYWTTTHYDDKFSYCFTFNKGREFVYYANRHGGHSVRLVTYCS